MADFHNFGNFTMRQCTLIVQRLNTNEDFLFSLHRFSLFSTHRVKKAKRLI